MQMLWIGCLESEEEFEIKARKGYNLASAQVSQQNLVKGIEQVSGRVFDSINGSVLPPYPVYKDRIVTDVEWSHKEEAWDISVGYKNDKYVNRINCKKAMLAASERWIADRYQGGDVTVFVYSMRSAPMATACNIKKRIPQAKIYLIITDLPQFMDLGQNKLKAALKKVDWLFIKKMQRKFDGFILYASQMAEYLSIPDDKWMLMEGSYDQNEELAVESGESKKAIMYSGKLDHQYGIALLLDSFMALTDPTIELWLTGGGNAETYIQECVLQDPRIRFFGFLPSRSDVLKLQQKASLLVNMRLPSEEASKYCFPSKLFEYMASGIPVMSFQIGGIPDEYIPYLFLIEKESLESMVATLKEWLDTDVEKLRMKGEAAKTFICNHKTLQKQSERICKFVGFGGT